MNFFLFFFFVLCPYHTSQFDYLCTIKQRSNNKKLRPARIKGLYMEISLKGMENYESVKDCIKDQQIKMQMNKINAFSEEQKRNAIERGISAIVDEYKKCRLQHTNYQIKALRRHAEHIAEKDPELFIWSSIYKTASENLDDALSFALSTPDYIFTSNVSEKTKLSLYFEADFRLSAWDKMEVLSGKKTIMELLK